MSKRTRFRLACLCALGLCASFPSLAADDLGPITITGSAIDDRFASSASDPASTTSFSREQVERQHAKNLVEVLRSVSGLTADLQGDGETLKIKLRGVENQRYMGEKPGVAIVIDGVPVFERTGKVNIDLDNIESIKVIKGGASWLYGEDALAGAVVITTRRGAGQKGFSVEADAGSFGYRRTLARGGFALDDLAGHLQFSDREQDGYYALSRTWSRTLSGNLKYALDGRSDLSLGVEASSRFRDREGSVTGASAAEADPRGVNGGRGYTRNFDVDLSRYNLTYSSDPDEHSNLLAVVYQYRDDTTFWSSPMRFTAAGAPTSGVDDYATFNDYTQLQRGFKSEYRTRTGDLAVMAGLEARRNAFANLNSVLNSHRTRPAGPVTAAGTVLGDDFTTEDTRALYGEAKLALSPRSAATLNLRHDAIAVRFAAEPLAGNGNRLVRERRDFDVTSYRLGLSHAWTAATTVYGALATGFRAPTSEQLFRGQTTTDALVQGNPDLQPEQSLSAEVGIRHQAHWGGWPVHLQAALFQVDRKDFILDSNGQYASTGNTLGGGSQFRNIGGARSRGLELELRTGMHRDWSFDLAYTYLDAWFTRYGTHYQTLGNGNGNFVANPTAAQRRTPGFWQGNFTVVRHDNTGKSLPRTPPHMLNVRLNHRPAPDWTLSAEIDHKAGSWADEINQERLPGRTLLHLTAQYQHKLVAWPGAQVGFFARVENVFDRRYHVTSRGANDANFDGRYDAEDPSIVADPGRVWRVGLSIRF